MQAASLCFTPPLPLKGTKPFVPTCLLTTRRLRRTVAVAVAAPSIETSTVDYSSSFSVFPAEACETVGGEACSAEMGPEVKPLRSSMLNLGAPEEAVEREYMEYNDPKTVFPGEACDELGGEFCEAEYQQGVHAEVRSR